MPTDKALDQVRERLRREEAQESEALVNHPGIQEVKAAGDRRREEARREEAQREAAREQARREGRDAEMEQLKAELKNAYLGAGGDPEGYEAAWPALRDREIERRTWAADRARQASNSYYESAF